MHTNWIETEFDGQIEPYAGELGEPDEPVPSRTVVVEVNGRRLEVKVPANWAAAAPVKPKKPVRRARGAKVSEASGNDLTSPMQGTIVKTAVSDGDTVAEELGRRSGGHEDGAADQRPSGRRRSGVGRGRDGARFE